MVGKVTEVIDVQPFVEHDPLVGHRYTRNVRLTLRRPGGGDYEIITNAAGIRSTREYEKSKPKGTLRILIFGDSFTAGQFVSNDQRFSELLERRVAGLEVINFGLEGTGTDQQLLLYENVGREFEHDMVMLLPFLQNIRRNMVEARIAIEPESLQEVLRPKPRFELVNGELLLRNVPVPNTRIANDGNAIEKTDETRGMMRQFKTIVSCSPAGKILKKILFQMKPWEPFPEYRNASSPEWQLMEAILRRFKKTAGARPFVIVPVFYDSYVRFRMARNYWERFRSLEEPGTYVIDILPHFQQLGSEAVRCFQGPDDCHFSVYGHLVTAGALQQELIKRGLLRGQC